MTQFLNDLLLAICAAAIPVAAVFAERLLRKFLDNFQAKVMNDYDELKKAEIESVVNQAVAYVSQTFVDSKKEDGDFTKDDAETAFVLAANTAKSLLTKEALRYITRTYNDVDLWLKTRIELAVRGQISL